MSRMVRRIIIATVFFVLNALFWTGVYYAFIKAPETCFDMKQNQNEEGMDCGGVCASACYVPVTGKEFEKREVAFVPGGVGRYDVFAKIVNGNSDVGASSFRYTFNLLDASGQVITSRSGENYILPQETKTLMELNLESGVTPALALLTITDVNWERFSGYQEKPTVNIYQKRFEQTGLTFGFGKAYGLVSNESPYDFRSIMVTVILRDAAGRPLAMNKTEQNTVRAGDARDFSLVFPTPFVGEVARLDMEVDADVYHSDNFVNQYFEAGR
ncbi:MAG: hypothetical protein E6Q53_00610 [Candidatus Moraniibacteriota bacterium]|jgi:hypothetical protein|nr:MAG: hypothetical protein E6Q53_00610 [Candidatus Moranbacteria bacterium]